ncbi:hypothetical protein ACFL6C_08655, partial [Myxococcota bacterium]
MPFDPLFTGPQRGDPCDDDTDCGPDLVCGRQDVCTTSKGMERDQPCGLTIECMDPLVCNGVTAVCADDDGSPGTLDFGAECVSPVDCRRPYICNLEGTCDKLPFYAGPDCTLSNDEAGAFRVYFELPAATLPEHYEFYRLPFPNDIRITTGRVSLAGHPSPKEVLGIGIPDTYISAVEEDVSAFAVNQPIFFRFSDIVDHATVCLDEDSTYPQIDDPEALPFCADDGVATVFLINIDSTSTAYNTRVPVQLAMSRDGGQYICQNWMGIAPLDGRPLEHETTYAAVITTGVHDLAGEPPIRDRDFADFMSGTQTVTAMQPLLDWISDQGIDASTFAGATVFTTGDPDGLADEIREAVRARPNPSFDPVSVLCDGTNVSPCNDGLGGEEHSRGCFGPYPDFRVVQGQYKAPAFQAGTRPFLTTELGGAFVLDEGLPVAQGTETMCFALAIPTGTVPAGGFPVVIYGHGTDGSYRGFIDQGIAAHLTDLGLAVLGFDNVMHGPRQQPVETTAIPAPALWQDPGRLFFNLANPRAARDNVLQGAADIFHLVRLVETGSLTPTGLGQTVAFDADHIYYLGHSQGTVIAPAVLATELNLQAAVLSGAGAELALSILNKKQPADLSVVASAFFADEGLSRIHPMMGLLAMMFGPADSVSYA